MRPYAILILIVIVIALSVRAYNHRKIPVVSFVLIGVLLAPLVIMEGTWIRTQRALSTATQVITAREAVTIHCQRLSDAFFFAGSELGHVMFDENGKPSEDAFITMETCQHARDWMNSDKSNPTQDQVIAIHVVTHEAMHLTGQTSEAISECYAIQKDAQMAELLGATPEQGQALARQYYMTVYPNMQEAYRTVTCQQDGTLDLTPNDDQWP